MKKKYVIATYFSHVPEYFVEFEKHEDDPTWTLKIMEAKKFDSYDDAFKELQKSHDYDWRTFRDGTYKIEELIVKSDE